MEGFCFVFFVFFFPIYFHSQCVTSNCHGPNPCQERWKPFPRTELHLTVQSSQRFCGDYRRNFFFSLSFFFNTLRWRQICHGSGTGCHLVFWVNRTRAFTVLTKADEGRNGLCDWLKNDPCSWCAADSESIKIKAQVGLKTKNFDRIVLRLISEQSSLVLLFRLEGGVNLLHLAACCCYSYFEMSLGA